MVSIHNEGKKVVDKEMKKKKRFTIADYWFHFGVLINLIVVLLLLWYAA